MVGFFLKKSFFDGFDNLWKLIILNVLYGFLLFIGISFPIHCFSGNFNYILVSLFVMSILFSSYSYGANYFLFKWSCYEQGSLKDCLQNYKGKFKLILIHSILSYLIFLVIPLSQYLYLSSRKPVGAFVALLLFDFEVILFLIHQFFFPVCYYYNSDGSSVVKRSFAIGIDSFGYSFLLILRSLFDFVLSVITFSAIPGICGIGLSRMDMVRLLAKRYKYIESNTGVTKKDVDWHLILEDDINSTGKRTIRSIIFPWKD